MNGFELNKIAASILLGGLIAMLSGTISDILYRPHDSGKRGYQVEVAESSNTEQAEDSAAKEAPIDIKALLATANAENGKKVTVKCISCHNFDKGGPNKVGPDLWDVVDRNKASEPGFNYSDAMKAKGGKWDYDSLFHFIHNPKEFLPGTKMTFVGLKKPQEVADVIAYLRTLSDNPAPLPTK